MPRHSIIDTLVDTLMALWNSTWRDKILPSFLAIVVVGGSLFLFFIQIDAPDFLPQSSASSQSSTHERSAQSRTLAVNPHVVTSIQTIAPTPGSDVTTKRPSAPTPTPVSAAPSEVADAPPAPLPAPMPVELPGIISAPGFDDSGAIGPINTVSTHTSSAPKRTTPPVKAHVGQATSAPSPAATSGATPPVSPTSTSGGTATPGPTVLPTPTAIVAPPPSPTNTVGGASPTVPIPVGVPTPTPVTSVYPTPSTVQNTPTNTATTTPGIVPSNGGGTQIATTVSPTPSAARPGTTTVAGQH